MTSLTRPLCILIKGTHFLRGNPHGTQGEPTNGVNFDPSILLNTPTEKISEFVDHQLSPLVPSIKLYTKDTNDFLRKLSEVRDMPDDVILCTVDVVGL